MPMIPGSRMDKLALKVSGVFFLLVCVLHIIRVLMKIQVTLNQVEVPLQASVVAAVVSLALAVWMFKSAYK
jgi:hypothetical protein